MENLDNFFDNYGELVTKVLDNRGLSQKWLAKKIASEDQNLLSLQQQVSRWIKTGAISEGYQKRIDKALDIVSKQDRSGRWTFISSRSQFDILNEEVSHYETSVADHIKLEPALDDPLKMIEYAEGLIRIARLKLESQKK